MKTYNKKCIYCNNSFNATNSRSLYCSRKCKDKYYIQKQQPNTICNYCGKFFYKKEAKKKQNTLHHCSKECHNKYMKKPSFKEFTCTECHSVFKKKRIYQLKNKNNPFCSVSCANKYNGKNHKGENHHNYNKNLTNKERAQKRDTYENIKWRREIFKRDAYKCTVCNRKGHLNAHHLENYSSCVEKRFNMNNGVTLCKECHKQFHNTFGYRNNTLLQFNKFKKSYKIQYK